MSTTTDADAAILRDLAKQYAEVCEKPVYDERRDLWRRHNSLERTRPLIYCRWFACNDEVVEPQLECRDPFYRAWERQFRHWLFQDRIGDDFVLEPWIAVQAERVIPEAGRWGVKTGRIPSTEDRGAWMFDPPIKEPDDLEKLVVPRHEIDEQKTAEKADRMHTAIGDILPVCVDRAPAWRGGAAGISQDLAALRGLEQMMWDMVERPDWLHRLVGFMRDGILKAQKEAEEAGDWRLCDHYNQAMPYATELDDPAPDERSVRRKDLWCFFASQETTQVSPEMFDEFILSYQIPIIETFGLSAYGCCEDLTRKIDVLRKIPNLRRIAVTPWADLAKCVEQIGDEYVISWRPSPAEHICSGFDPDFVRDHVRSALDTCRGCHVDITLKDIETVGNQPERLIEWTRVVRETIDEYA